jgi:hypothetical protein
MFWLQACQFEFVPQETTKWCCSKVGCLASTGVALYGNESDAFEGSIDL